MEGTTRKAWPSNFASVSRGINGQSVERPHSVNPAYDVYDGGQYVGSDPDPNVRQQLRREHEAAGNRGSNASSINEPRANGPGLIHLASHPPGGGIFLYPIREQSMQMNT